MGEPPSRPPLEDKEAFALHALYEPTEDDAEWKELKVLIPAVYHARLRALKVVTGRTITELAVRALEQYFMDMEQEREQNE